MNTRRKILSGFVVAAFAILYFVAMMPNTHSYPPFLNKTKQMGLPAKDCTYCHTSAQGGDNFNARGNWLIEQKKTKGAPSVDVTWLKEYKDGSKKAGNSTKKVTSKKS